jgi:hypothetical protein
MGVRIDDTQFQCVTTAPMTERRDIFQPANEVAALARHEVSSAMRGPEDSSCPVLTSESRRLYRQRRRGFDVKQTARAAWLICILTSAARGAASATGAGEPTSSDPGADDRGAPLTTRLAPNAASTDGPATSPTPTAPAPYSLPWQLRPALAVSVVRSDTAVAFYADAASNAGATVASTMLVSYKVTPDIAPLMRLGFVQNSPPSGDGALSFVNPVLGGVYAMKPSPELRLALFLGVTVPIGQGGGDAPDASRALATRSGILARSAMDNAMFAVNDFVVIPGADIAWIASGITVQLEVTLLQLTRVRGAQAQADASRTNFTSGIHVGYFLLRELSIGAELRHQRWLSTPAAVERDSTLRDTTTFAIGPRVHLKVGDSLWLRPGIAYARGIDEPMTTLKYNIIQFDLPVVF